MHIRGIDDAIYFCSHDGCSLCELLHPKNDPDIDMDASICHAYLQPGKATVPHCLKHQSEVYYVLSGEGLMHIDDEAGLLSVGQAVYIPPGATQWIENTGEGELVFLAICSPQWAESDEEILDSSDNSEARQSP